MAKKTKKSKAGKAKAAESEPKVEVAKESTPTEESKPEPKPEVAEIKEETPAPKPQPKKEEPKAAPGPQKIKLQDACRRFVVGYKDHWYQSIGKYAATQGFSDPSSADECKEILRRWGAKLK